MTAERLHSVQEYYFSRKLREVAQMAKAGKPIINMGIGSPDLPPHPHVVEALQDALQHPQAHRYQSYQGLPELRAAFTNFYKKHYNVTLKPDQEVLPLMGSKEGIMHISMAFLNKGDKALIPNPGYPTYSAVTKLLEAESVYYKLDASNGWQPDLNALEAMNTKGIKLMWLNYPHMPTGSMADSSMFERLIAWAKHRGILLVNDNPYSFILNDNPQSILDNPNALDVAMELNSLSKSFNMAGWRVGMLAGNESNIRAVLKVKSNMDSGMFYGIQRGAIAALQLPITWFEQLNSIYQERREAMTTLATLLDTAIAPQSVGLFLWAKLNGTHLNAEDYIDTLLHQYHLFITPGTVFGSQGAGYIRFSLCVPLPQIETAIKRIKS